MQGRSTFAQESHTPSISNWLFRTISRLRTARTHPMIRKERGEVRGGRISSGIFDLQVREDGVACSAPQLYPEYAPDHYAIFFSDPDGIRLEVTNYRQE